MKRVLIFLLCILAMPAIADEPWDNVYIVACPTCTCPDGKTSNAQRNSYAGMRVYQNVRAEYLYSPHGAPREKNDKENMGFGTTMGLRFTNWLRGEYETLYMGAQYTADMQNFEYDLWANMLNLYLYRDIHDVVAPYIGGGIGLTAIWGSIDGVLSNATKISYQAMVGILFELGPAIELEFGIKYIDFGKISHARGDTSVDAAQFYLGAIYRFET